MVGYQKVHVLDFSDAQLLMNIGLVSRKMYSGKLGLPSAERELVLLLLSVMEETKADFTMVFRELSELAGEGLEQPCPASQWALATLAKHDKYRQFLASYREKLAQHGESPATRIHF